MGRERETGRSWRISEVKGLGEGKIHHTAGFYHACVKGPKSVSSDQWEKLNTSVI